MSIRAAGLWCFCIPTVETASDAAATVKSAETESLPPEQRDEWEDRLCTAIGCAVGLAVRLRAAPGGRPPRCPAAAAGSGTGTCASPGSRTDAHRPLGQYPEGDVRKAAGVITRRSGRGIAVLYRLSGRALPQQSHQCGRDPQC